MGGDTTEEGIRTRAMVGIPNVTVVWGRCVEVGHSLFLTGDVKMKNRKGTFLISDISSHVENANKIVLLV